MAALVLAGIGVLVLIDLRWSSDPWGLFWAFLNSACFATYLVLGHQAAESEAANGIERLGAAMLVAFSVIVPIGAGDAVEAFLDPVLPLAGIGVGLCSSVVPYVCDQLAMSRLPRVSFDFSWLSCPRSPPSLALSFWRRFRA